MSEMIVSATPTDEDGGRDRSDGAARPRGLDPIGVLRSLILCAVAVALVVGLIRDLRFAAAEEPVRVDGADRGSALRNGDYASVDLGLALDEAVGVSTLSDRELLLVPFAGTDRRLFFAVEGPIVEGDTRLSARPYVGRVATKDFADEWDLYGRGFALLGVFERSGLEIHPDTRVLYLADKALPGIWQFLVATASLLYLAKKAYDLSRFLGARDAG